MSIVVKIKHTVRGDITLRTFVLEAIRRIRVLRARRREREQLTTLNQQPARLGEEFARMPASDLLAHFHSRATPEFFPGFASTSGSAELQASLFPNETSRLLAQANRIRDEHCWPLLGFGENVLAPERLIGTLIRCRALTGPLPITLTLV